MRLIFELEGKENDLDITQLVTQFTYWSDELRSLLIHSIPNQLQPLSQAQNPSNHGETDGSSNETDIATETTNTTPAPVEHVIIEWEEEQLGTKEYPAVVKQIKRHATIRRLPG